MVKTIEQPGFGPVRQLAPPWDFEGTPAEIRRPAPQLGEHGAEILAETGYTEAEIAALQQSGTVVQ